MPGWLIVVTWYRFLDPRLCVARQGCSSGGLSGRYLRVRDAGGPASGTPVAPMRQAGGRSVRSPGGAVVISGWYSERDHLVARGHQAANARVVVLLLEQLDVRVVDAFLGIEGAGAVAAGTGDHIPHVLEQPVRLVLRIGQQAQPLRTGTVEDQL